YDQRLKRPPGEIVVELARTLRDYGLDQARIGIEFLATPLSLFEPLHAELPDALFVPADEMLERLRAVKTDDELELMRTGAQAAQRGILAAINAATPAWSDKDLAEAINIGMLAEGLDAVLLVLVGSGDAAKGFFPATSAPMQRGSLVRIDILAVLKGYAIDI